MWQHIQKKEIKGTVVRMQREKKIIPTSSMWCLMLERDKEKRYPQHDTGWHL